MRRYRTIRGLLGYNRTLLAVYWLADDGVVCLATNAELAAEVGLTAPSMLRYLRELERAGVIAIFHLGDQFGAGGRRIVLLDHPDAIYWVDLLGVRRNGRLSPYSETGRELVEDLRVNPLLPAHPEPRGHE